MTTEPTSGDIAAALRPEGEIDLDALARRAEREELLDIAYAEHDSPYGTLLLAATPRGLVRVGLAGRPIDEQLQDLARELSPRLLEAPARLDTVRRELEEYFEGRRRAFDLDLDWRPTHGFIRKVLRETARIGYGHTLSYAEVAGRAGSPRAHRAAGSALAANPIPIVVPCHRVVRSDGTAGNYGGGPQMKQALLELEGAL